MGITKLRIGHGGAIAINEFGDPDGYPILVNHGMIASIADEGLLDGLAKAGFRVMSLARPGYGLSEPFELRNIGEWGRIAQELVEAKGLGKFDLLGMSSGAPYAYAIAHALPAMVGTTYIFSGVPCLGDERVRRIWPYPLNEGASLETLQDLAQELFFEDGVDPKDRGSLDSANNRCFGIALDLKIRCQDWGFSLGDIKTKVHIEHSKDDESIPLGMAEITAGLLANCHMMIREGGGHFSPALLEDFIKRRILAPRGA